MERTHTYPYRRYIGQDLFTVPRPWQKTILALAAAKPKKGERRVIVVVDKNGGAGKTSLTKWMQFHLEATVLGWGADRDLQYLAATATKKHLYVFDLARSKPKAVGEQDAFAAMEAIKNGSVMKSKWETANVMFPTPIVICFMNYMPDLTLLSKDRWCIFTLNDGKMSKYTI